MEKGRHDLWFVEGERRVAGQENAQQRIAPGDQRDVSRGPLNGLRQVDHGERQPDLLGVPASGPGHDIDASEPVLKGHRRRGAQARAFVFETFQPGEFRQPEGKRTLHSPVSAESDGGEMRHGCDRDRELPDEPVAAEVQRLQRREVADLRRHRPRETVVLKRDRAHAPSPHGDPVPVGDRRRRAPAIAAGPRFAAGPGEEL